MYSKKIFPTACMGFSKNAVLDYIYEQDKIAEDKKETLETEIKLLKEELNRLKEQSKTGFDDNILENTFIAKENFGKSDNTDSHENNDRVNLKAVLYQAEASNKLLKANCNAQAKREKEYINKIMEQEKEIAKYKNLLDNSEYKSIIAEKDSTILKLKELNKRLEDTLYAKKVMDTKEILAHKDIEIKHLYDKNKELADLLNLMQDKLDSLQTINGNSEENEEDINTDKIRFDDDNSGA